jgi:biofilm PGA synthesis protein PgaA
VPTATYFNPSRDHAVDLTLLNEWLTWRFYTNAFRQRLALSVGQYWQNGFNTGATYGVRYEHQWDWQERLSLRYGIGHSAHPYDGVREPRDYAYIHLNWRF